MVPILKIKSPRFPLFAKIRKGNIFLLVLSSTEYVFKISFNNIIYTVNSYDCYFAE